MPWSNDTVRPWGPEHFDQELVRSMTMVDWAAYLLVVIVVGLSIISELKDIGLSV